MTKSETGVEKNTKLTEFMSKLLPFLMWVYRGNDEQTEFV
jgi:hypothetical protein